MRRRLLMAMFPLFLVALGNAQGLRLGADVGAVRQVGQEWEQWEWGLSFGLNALVGLTDNIQLGGRLAYNRWRPDDTEFQDVFQDLENGAVTGRASVFEILPIIRVGTNAETSFINGFAQVGAGLYIVDQQVTVTGNIGEEVREQVFGPGRENRFGVSVGGGVILGNPRYFSVDIYPLFNYVWLEDASLRYLTINAGVSLGF